LREGTTGRFILLLVLQFPFFLGTELGLLALFFSAFIFTASVAHICFSLFKKTSRRIVASSGLCHCPGGEVDAAVRLTLLMLLFLLCFQLLLVLLALFALLFELLFQLLLFLLALFASLFLLLLQLLLLLMLRLSVPGLFLLQVLLFLLALYAFLFLLILLRFWFFAHAVFLLENGSGANSYRIDFL
jgi:hypothetical protein